MDRIKYFKTPKKIMNMAIRLCVNFMNSSQCEHLQQIFQKLDKEKVGYISIENLEYGFQRAGIPIGEEDR
jgi:Ca2+-binding EF-hand superfamily protein